MIVKKFLMTQVINQLTFYQNFSIIILTLLIDINKNGCTKKTNI